MAGRAASIKFPKVAPGSNYRSFLKAIVDKHSSNRRAFALTDQSTVLEEFEKQLEIAYPHDESLVRKRMEEACGDGQGEWKHWQKSLSYLVKNSDDAGETTALELPKVGRAHGAKYDVFDKQTYADFADKAKQRNADYVFTKENMDQAFTLAAKLVKKKVWKASTAQYDRMMARCLGKESDEYWKE